MVCLMVRRLMNPWLRNVGRSYALVEHFLFDIEGGTGVGVVGGKYGPVWVVCLYNCCRFRRWVNKGCLLTNMTTLPRNKEEIGLSTRGERYVVVNRSL